MLASTIISHSATKVFGSVRASALLSAITVVIGIFLNIVALFPRTFAKDSESQTPTVFDALDAVSTLEWTIVLAAIAIATVIFQENESRLLRFFTKTKAEASIQWLYEYRARRLRNRFERAQQLLQLDAPKSASQRRWIATVYRETPRDRSSPTLRATRLGNVLAKAEQGPWLGLNIDLSLVGPPLIGLLDDKERKPIDGPRAGIDIGLGMWRSLSMVGATSILSCAIALSWAGISTSAIIVLSTVGVGAIAGAHFAYAAALRSANQFRDGLELIILLYRFRLLKELALRLPSSLQEEQTAFIKAESIIRLSRSGRSEDSGTRELVDESPDFYKHPE